MNLWLDDPHTPWVPNAAAGKGASTLANLKSIIEETDRQMGRLRAGLKRLGVEDNTLIVFTSDNSPLPTLQGQRSGGLRGCKLSLYEGGIRVPCIAVLPGTIPSGHVDEASVVGALDMYQTLCTIAGVKSLVAPATDGEDCTSALFGKAKQHRSKPLIWEYGRNDRHFQYPPEKENRSPNLAIRDGRWKLLMNNDGSGAELYDLEADRGESTNLAAKQPDVRERLSATLLAWLHKR